MFLVLYPSWILFKMQPQSLAPDDRWKNAAAAQAENELTEGRWESGAGEREEREKTEQPRQGDDTHTVMADESLRFVTAAMPG